jgi:Domain of unknown function (DUF3291)
MVAEARIAHFNAARLLHPPGDPRVAEFVDNTIKVNAVAERSPGFVWRLGDEASTITLAGYKGEADDPHVVYSLSIWDRFADFELFVHKTVHGAFLRRRSEWFAPWQGPNYVLWDFAGSGPITASEGFARLQHLASHGASDHAYDFAFAKTFRPVA